MGKRKKKKGRKRNRGGQQSQAASTAVATDESSGSSGSGSASASAATPSESAPSKPAPSKPAQSKSGGSQEGGDGSLKELWAEWAYKHKRGPLVRWVSFGVGYFLVVFGLHTLYILLEATSKDNPEGMIGWWAHTIAEFPLPLMEEMVYVDIGLLVTIGIGIGLGLVLLHTLFKRADVSEFMIDCETEMHKVSWPSQQELKGSTIAVVIAVFLLGLYLFFVDMVLAAFFEVLIGFES